MHPLWPQEAPQEEQPQPHEAQEPPFLRPLIREQMIATTTASRTRPTSIVPRISPPLSDDDFLSHLAAYGNPAVHNPDDEVPPYLGDDGH